jgi:hypothetical protein
MGTQFEKYTTNIDYIRCTRQTLSTRRLYFWAEGLECFWLLHLYASHLYSIDGMRQPFTVLKLTVKNQAATIRIEDGNDTLLGEQFVDYTDLKLPAAQLFARWQAPYWVMMLPSDY